ncbi:MAG: hypothetical protein JSV89_04730 [Spirochaetaceae bacterium]|nr:MAG: hypothetical protein JSV89_04730 [Spirochaetaceae bacterium]
MRLVSILVFIGTIFSTFADQETAIPPKASGKALYEELAVSLERAEALVAEIVLQDGAFLTKEEMEALASLNRQIRGTLYSDLIDRSDLLLLLSREQMRIRQDTQEPGVRLDQILQDSQQETRSLKRSDSREKLFRASLATSLTSYALAFTLWGLGELQDQLYFEASTTEEAARHRRLFQVFSIGSMLGATIGTFSAGLSVTLYVKAK